MDPSVRGQPDGGRSCLAAEMGNETFIDRRMEFIYKEQPQKLYIGRKIFRPRYQAPVAGAPKTTATRHMDVPDIVSQSANVNVDVNKNVIASKKGGTIYREIKSEAADNREMRSVQSTNNPEVIMRTKKSVNESDVSMRTAQSAESPEISRRISQSMAPEMSTRTIQSMNTPKIQMADRTSRYGAVDVGAQREKTDQEGKKNVFGIETGQSLSMPPPPTVPDLVADTRQVAVDSATRVHSGPQGSVHTVDGGRVDQGGSVGIQDIVDGRRVVQGGSVGVESVYDGGRVVQGGSVEIESVNDGGRVVQGGPQGNVQIIDDRRVVHSGAIGVESVVGGDRVVQSGAPRIGSTVLQSGTVGKEQFIDKREETLPVNEPEKVMRRVPTFQVQPLAFSSETSSGQTPSVHDSSVVHNISQAGSVNLTQGTLSHDETPKDEEPTMRTKRTPPKPRPRSSKLHLDATSVPLSPLSTPAQVTVQDGARVPSPRASDEKTFDLPPPPRGQEYNTLDISHMLVLPKLPPLELSKGRPRSMVVEPSRVEVSDTQVPSMVLAARPVSASYSYNPVSSDRGPSVSDRTEHVTQGRHASTLERQGTGQDRQGFSLERHAVTQERPDFAPARPDMAPARQEIAPVRPDMAPARQEIAPVRPDMAPARQEIAPVRPDMAPARQEIAPVRPDMAPARQELAPVGPDMAPAGPDMAQNKREMELGRHNVTLERPDMTQESQAMTLTRQTATQSRPVMAPTGENVSLERTDVTQFRQDVTQARPEVTLERQGMTLTNQVVSVERADVTQYRQDVTQSRPEMTQERQAMTLANQEASLERPDVTQARPNMTPTKNVAVLDRADVTVASQDVIQAQTETRTNDTIKATTEASTERMTMAQTMEAPVAETVPPVSTTSEVEQAAAERFPIGDKEVEPFVRGSAKIKPMVMTKPFGLRSSGRNTWAPVRYTKVEPNDASSKPIEAATTIVNTPTEIKQTETESNVVLTKTYDAPPVAAKPYATNRSENISSELKGESQMNVPPPRQTVVGVDKTAEDSVIVRVQGVGDGVNTTFVDRTMETIDVTSVDRITIGQGTVFSYDGSKPIASVSGYGSLSKAQEIHAARPTTQASETSGLVFHAPEQNKTAMIERPGNMSTAQSHIAKDSETIIRTSPQAYLPEPTGSEDVQIVKSQDPQSLQSTPRDIFYQNIQDVQLDDHRGATTIQADESITSITKSTDTTRESELQMTYNSAPVVQSVQSVQPVPPVKPAKPQLLTKPVRLSSDLTDVDDNKPKPKPKPKPMLFGAKPFSATPRSVTSVKVPRPGQAWTGYSQQSNTDANTLSITRDIIGSSRCPSGGQAGQAAAIPRDEDSEYRLTDTSTSDENRSVEKDTSQTETLTKHMEVQPEAEVKSRTVPVQSVKPFSVESRTLSTVTAPSQQPRQDVTISHITEDMGFAVGDKTSYMDSNRPATVSAPTLNTTSSRQICGVVSPGALDDEVDAVKYEDSIGFRQNIVSHSAGPGLMNTSDVIGSARYPGGQSSMREGQEAYTSVETNIRGVETTEEVVLRSKPSGSESTAREVTRTSSITGSRPLAFQPRKRSSYVISAAKKKTPEDTASNTTLNMSETSVESATRRVSQTSVDSAPDTVRKLSQSSLDSSSDASANLSQSSIEYQQGLLAGGDPKRSSTLVYSTHTTAPSRRVMSGGYATSNVVPAVNVDSSGVGQEKQVDQITDRYTAGDPHVIQSSRTTHMIYSSGPSVSTTAYNTSTQGSESALRLTGPETRSVPMSTRDIIGSARYPGGRRSPRDEDQSYTSVETSVSNVDMNTRTVETTDETVLRNPSAQASSSQREVTRTSSITASRPPSFQARKRSSYVISAAKKKSVTDDSPPSVAPKPVSSSVSESNTITAGHRVSTETSSLIQGRHSATERPITGQSISPRATIEHSMNSYNEQSIDRKMDTVDAASPQVLQVRGEMSYVPYPAGEEGDRLSVIVTDL